VQERRPLVDPPLHLPDLQRQMQRCTLNKRGMGYIFYFEFQASFREISRIFRGTG
jgi:hypothetical protein